jgi:hypothetical protein
MLHDGHLRLHVLRILLAHQLRLADALDRHMLTAALVDTQMHDAEGAPACGRGDGRAAWGRKNKNHLRVGRRPVLIPHKTKCNQPIPVFAVLDSNRRRVIQILCEKELA